MEKGYAYNIVFCDSEGDKWIKTRKCHPMYIFSVLSHGKYIFYNNTIFFSHSVPWLDWIIIVSVIIDANTVKPILLFNSEKKIIHN